VEAPPASEQPLALVVADTESIPGGDAIAFLQKCLDHYNQQSIAGYSLRMHKQERIGGKLQPSEEIEVCFRTKPYSVFMHWLRGERLAANVLYVEGMNDGKMLVRPAGIAGKLVKVVSRDPEGEEAKQSGRYPVTQLGPKKTLERTLKDWKAASNSATSKIEFLGMRNLREAGDRLCYALRRTCTPSGTDDAAEITIYVDKETSFQVGTVLKDAAGKLLGEYIYRDIQLNPVFKPNQFESSAVAP